MALGKLKNRIRSWRLGSIYKYALTILIVSAVILSLVCNASYAADKTDNLWKYQVVPGSDDKAYLVDTSTGAVWILTYRTLATGREPVAIPYKFIEISPKNQKDLVEKSKGALLPAADKQ